MSEPTQEVIRETVTHDGYPHSHEPLHKRNEVCGGCDDYRSRRGRNHRAGKSIGVSIRGRKPDEPSGGCKACKTPVYAAQSGEAPAWAWNFDVDRAQWALEPRPAKSPRSLCPRCRPKADAA